MQTIGITPAMLKTAWKMVNTVFAEHRCLEPDRNLMLNLTVAVALHDLLDNRLEWKNRPAKPWRLVFRGGQVGTTHEPGPGILRAQQLDREVDHASTQVESLFDRYQLDEDERDTMFTALPCLGLKAMGKWVRWKTTPPFPEVGS